MSVGAPAQQRSLLFDSARGALAAICSRGKPLPEKTALDVLSYALSTAPEELLPLHGSTGDDIVDSGVRANAVHGFVHLQVLIAVVPTYALCTGIGASFFSAEATRVQRNMHPGYGELAAAKGGLPCAVGTLAGVEQLAPAVSACTACVAEGSGAAAAAACPLCSRSGRTLIFDDARGEGLRYTGDRRAPTSGLGALEQHEPTLLRAAGGRALELRGCPAGDLGIALPVRIPLAAAGLERRRRRSHFFLSGGAAPPFLGRSTMWLASPPMRPPPCGSPQPQLVGICVLHVPAQYLHAAKHSRDGDALPRRHHVRHRRRGAERPRAKGARGGDGRGPVPRRALERAPRGTLARRLLCE
jgi:hypothetical protein